jgi:pyruvate dehydrogenase E2 component (dihydrolipoamide acetyltransferase)
MPAAPRAEPPAQEAPAAARPAGVGAQPERRAPRANASPVARRLAAELGVELAELTGSGPGGQITRDDVEAAAAGRTGAPAAAAPTAKGDTRIVELSRLQRTIARRMTEGSELPTFAVELEVDMTSCVALRGRLDGGEPVPSLNDFVVKASSLALREFPRLNGSYTERGFELYSAVNVGIAVATEDGLVVPTIRDSDRKSLAQIAREAKELSEKTRAGTVTPAELDGGTFTVSNLGMLGVRRFMPIVNPPQAAILGIGRVAKVPAFAEDGSVVAHELMSATLVCDHRIVYGAEAARFLSRLAELLEEPEALVDGTAET